MKYYAELKDHIRSLPVVSSHCHHMRDENYRGMGLSELFERSYLVWAERPRLSFSDREGWADYLLRNRANSFVRWLIAALEELYGLPFAPENLPELDRRVREAYSRDSHHIDILKGPCRFERAVNERQPNPGDDLGYPALFSPSFRCDCFFSGYLAGKPEPNGFFARSLFSDPEALTLERYYLQMRRAVEEKKRQGCRALKVAMAYERPIAFEKQSPARAGAALNNPGASEGEILAFGDGVMFELARIAADTGLPLQIHTGTGQLKGTNPMGLLELIRENPGTKFHLLHGGWPWTDDLLALLFAFPNVYADLCWIPYLSSSAARNFIVAALEVSGAHRLTWGDDAWMADDSLGALRAMEHCLARALSDMLRDGAIDSDYAKYIAGRIMGGNARELFSL